MDHHPRRRLFPASSILEGVAVDKVDGDGNCFFAVIGKAVGRLRGEPARKAAQVRAEVCAHLRKHRESYEAFWNGKDSQDAPLGGALAISTGCAVLRERIFILALAKSTQPGDFPRGGAKNAEKTDAETEHTYFIHFGVNAGGDEAVSERTTCANDNVVAKPVEVAGDAASVGAPSESTVFTKKEVKNRTIQDWFVQARRASSDAVTGVRSTALDTAADEVILPVTVRRWRGVTRRAAHSSWRCPECGWSTGRTKYWCRVKAAHIAKFHSDLKKELNLRERAIKLVPYSAATCCWKCPVDGCDMGLPAVDSTTDARGKAAHPDKPIGLFLLKMGTAAKARKATMTKVKLSAGAAQRIQELKAGEAGDHDVVCVKLPPAKFWRAARARSAVQSLVLCASSASVLQPTPKPMAAHPCRTTSAGAKRPGLLKRLRDTRDRGNIEPELVEPFRCGGAAS